MRTYDLIEKKRDGKPLTDQEIQWLVDGYVKGEVPDYQMAAFLMAVYFRGMTDRETAVMTDCVARSGETADLSGIPGIKVDKHSTGGVGDKTTLIVVPIVAACGGIVAKMSGKGLGHTGGTIDKLESIPGYRTQLSQKEFFSVVRRVGASVIGQSGNLAPADKKLYALRDVTATVDSIPLIAVSIMGKKLAGGSDRILLDVKTGSGAFMKTMEDSVKLAQKMVAIGEHAGRRTSALITDMDVPLGHFIGNALEVREAVCTLKNQGPEDLTEVCTALAAEMLYLSDKGSRGECRKMAERSIADGSALRKLKEMVSAQGGSASALEDPQGLPICGRRFEVRMEESGYISHMDAQGIGAASMLLGAGRETKDSAIDYGAGIELKRKTGEYVSAGEAIAVLYASDDRKFADAQARFRDAVVISEEKPAGKPLILARVDSRGTEFYQ